MPTYTLNEGAISIPQGWRDHTVNAFALHDPDRKNEASFVISREIVANRTLSEYLDQQLAQAAKKMNRYRLLGRRETQVGAKEAVEVEYAWSSPEGIGIFQRQTVLIHGSQFLVFTWSAREKDREQMEPLWAGVMQSIQLNQVD